MQAGPQPLIIKDCHFQGREPWGEGWQPLRLASVASCPNGHE